MPLHHVARYLNEIDPDGRPGDDHNRRFNDAVAVLAHAGVLSKCVDAVEATANDLAEAMRVKALPPASKTLAVKFSRPRYQLLSQVEVDALNASEIDRIIPIRNSEHGAQRIPNECPSKAQVEISYQEPVDEAYMAACRAAKVKDGGSNPKTCIVIARDGTSKTEVSISIILSNGKRMFEAFDAQGDSTGTHLITELFDDNRLVATPSTSTSFLNQLCARCIPKKSSEVPKLPCGKLDLQKVAFKDCVFEMPPWFANACGKIAQDLFRVHVLATAAEPYGIVRGVFVERVWLSKQNAYTTTNGTHVLAKCALHIELHQLTSKCICGAHKIVPRTESLNNVEIVVGFCGGEIQKPDDGDASKPPCCSTHFKRKRPCCSLLFPNVCIEELECHIQCRHKLPENKKLGRQGLRHELPHETWRNTMKMISAASVALAKARGDVSKARFIQEQVETAFVGLERYRVEQEHVDTIGCLIQRDLFAVDALRGCILIRNFRQPDKLVQNQISEEVILESAKQELQKSHAFLFPFKNNVPVKLGGTKL